MRRIARHGFSSFVLIFVSLGIGEIGYHLPEELGWIDAAVNAAMVLGGMERGNELHTNAGKLLAAALHSHRFMGSVSVSLIRKFPGSFSTAENEYNFFAF